MSAAAERICPSAAASDGPRHAKVNADQHAALMRLLMSGAGNTGQSRRVADFLLAWWNSGSCGGFDITTAWGVDQAIAIDMVRVFALAVSCQQYPDTLGYGTEFGRVVASWRPELTDVHETRA